MAAPRRPNPDRIVDAALTAAEHSAWRDVSLESIAAEAKVSLAQLHAVFPSRMAILDSFSARVDAAVLAGGEASDADQPTRERLLDVLMRRIEALEPHKRAVGSIMRDTLGDPCQAACAGPRLLRAMRWMLEASGIGSSGLIGTARAKYLAAVYVSTLFVWQRDDSPDLGRTLAHLDRALRRAERLAMGCSRFSTPFGRRAPEAT